MRQPHYSDIFCRVVDNFGDIGVCWRLARELRVRFGHQVRLWVDDLASFQRLAPSMRRNARQQNLDGIEVHLWEADIAAPSPLGDWIVEGFACDLPSSYLSALGQSASRPFWINLEYLTAESWASGCHGLPSPSPLGGKPRSFWFPGFDASTGGLLRESELLRSRDRFQDSRAEQAEFWASIGLPQAMYADYRLSLFAYENSALPILLGTLMGHRKKTLLAVPEGRVLNGIGLWLGELPALNQLFTRGNLTIAVIPMLSHDHYDRLLWACDLNLVRGEDSFVRAQWAGRPLLWHIYPQDEQAHLVKLQAFTDRVSAIAPLPAWADCMAAWNDAADPNTLLQLPDRLAAWQPAARQWTDFLAKQDDLCTRLMHFCQSQVE